MPSRSTLVFGSVAYIRLYVTRPNDDGQLFGTALELQGRLRNEIESQIRAHLGQEFELESLNIEKGSVTLLIAISAAGAFFMGFSRYESFIKSMNLLVQQLKDIMRRIFGRNRFSDEPNPVEVSGSWEPNESMAAANKVFTETSDADPNRLLQIYLIMSHAALLGVMLWLIIRHLK